VPAPFIHCREADIKQLEGWLLSRRVWTWLQANRQPGGDDGRATMVGTTAETVNGMDVRAAEPWRSTGKASLIEAGLDFACYTINRDGSREPFEPYREVSDKARRAKARSATMADVMRDSDAMLMARIGADTTLADGTA